MKRRYTAVALALAALFVLGLLSVPALSGRAQPEARCTAARHTKNHKALAAFKKTMLKQRAAYFRTHKSAKLRARYVKAQQARLSALTKAAACKVVKSAPKRPTTTIGPIATTTTAPLPPTSTTTTVASTTVASTTPTTTPSTTTTPPTPPPGTLRLNVSGTSVRSVDPSLAYDTLSWQLEYATALKLYNYPDAPAPDGTTLVPEAAVGPPAVSADGTTYTITVMPGYRFSDGTPVTAENFAYAINRALQFWSPAVDFIGDIVGADEVLDGTAETASGVNVDGNTLTIELTEPDGGLPAKLAMPFFQALPLDLPLVSGIQTYASAGPYYFAGWKEGSGLPTMLFKRNPHYTGTRPTHFDVIEVNTWTNASTSLAQVESGAVDLDLVGVPTSAHADLAARYGVNVPGGRYHVNPMNEVDYIALNTSRPPFSDVDLRKAVNYALDRAALASARGPYATQATDQILPPGVPGARDADLYPLDKPDYDRARELAGDRCGTVQLWTTSSTLGQTLGAIASHDLEQLGCAVETTLFDGNEIYEAAGERGADFDLVFAGWNQDYPDAYDFLDMLLNGGRIQDYGNNNLAYFDDPVVNAKLAAANRLVGADRLAAYGDLDVEIMRDHAPWAPYGNRNRRDFTSERLDGYLLQPAFSFVDLLTLSVRAA